jgi:hypothetical protein
MFEFLKGLYRHIWWQPYGRFRRYPIRIMTGGGQSRPPTVTREAIEEYWIGRGVDYGSIWRAYEAGTGYINKYDQMKAHLLVIEFETPDRSDPLFEHEAVFKTIKGYFHDMKHECLAPEAYAEAGPLFFYSVDRGSGIFKFLGELRQLITFGSTLADEKLMGRHLNDLDRRLDFLKKHFGKNVDEEMFHAFMRARTTEEMDYAVEQLFRRGIKSVKISKEPFRGNIERTQRSLVEVKDVGRETDSARGTP